MASTLIKREKAVTKLPSMGLHMPDEAFRRRPAVNENPHLLIREFVIKI